MLGLPEQTCLFRQPRIRLRSCVSAVDDRAVHDLVMNVAPTDVCIDDISAALRAMGTRV